MTEEKLQKDFQRVTGALPIYLAVQLAILLITLLDSQVYMDAYRVTHLLSATGWLGAWYLLMAFGLGTAVFLLIKKSYKIAFEERTRGKLAMGYFFGSIIGMLNLGMRFMPVISPQYFLIVGVLALLLGSGYYIWKKRGQTVEEMFP